MRRVSGCSSTGPNVNSFISNSFLSAQCFGQLLPAENVKMQVFYRLTAIFTVVCDDAVAGLADARLFGNFGDDLKNVSNCGRVFLCDGVSRRDVSFGNH